MPTDTEKVTTYLTASDSENIRILIASGAANSMTGAIRVALMLAARMVSGRAMVG